MLINFYWWFFRRFFVLWNSKLFFCLRMGTGHADWMYWRLLLRIPQIHTCWRHCIGSFSMSLCDFLKFIYAGVLGAVWFRRSCLMRLVLILIHNHLLSQIIAVSLLHLPPRSHFRPVRIHLAHNTIRILIAIFIQYSCVCFYFLDYSLVLGWKHLRRHRRRLAPRRRRIPKLFVILRSCLSVLCFS